MRHPLSRPAALALGAALLLAACGDDGDAADESAADTTVVATSAMGPSTVVDSTAADAAAFPVTIEHAFGQTEIPVQPERVAGVEWGNHDVVLALGVVPVGMPAMSYGDEDGDGILPWAAEVLDELGVTAANRPMLFDETDGLAYEQVAASRPDVIVSAYSGLDENEYELLTPIAPTVAYPETPWYTSWRDMALINATAIGRRADAEALVAALEQRIAEQQAEHPQVAGKTFTFGYIDPENPSEITVFNDARTELLEEFGMRQSPTIAALFEGSEDFSASVSAERIDLIDADILVLYGDADTLDLLASDPILSTIPAVQSGAVAVVIDGSPMAAAIGGITVLSLDWVLDDYFALFADAATAADAA